MSEEAIVKPEINIDVAQEVKKPRLQAVLFCDYSSDSIDNKANLLGIFDRIYVHPDKKATPEFELYVRTVETLGRLKVSIIDPSGNLVSVITYSEKGERTTPNLPLLVELQATVRFKASVEGVYWFDVSCEGESLGGAGLAVAFRTSEGKNETDTYI